MTLVDRIDLSLDAGPSLGGVNGIYVKDTTFVVVDSRVMKLIYEYSRSGAFRRVIGERGRSSAGYMIPKEDAMGVDERGRLYVYDAGTGKTKVYGEDGTMEADLGRRLGMTDRMSFDGAGRVLQLTQEDGIAYLRKYGDDLEVLFDLPLTGRNVDALVWHFATFSGFRVHREQGFAYYLEPGGYVIRVLGLEGGEVVGAFGCPPPRYTSISEQFHGIGYIQDPADAEPISRGVTFLRGGMYFLGERYLLLGFAALGERELSWQIHDVEAPGSMYSLDSDGIDLLAVLRARTSDDGLLYGYVEPEDDELDVSNGHIESYRLDVDHRGGEGEAQRTSSGIVASECLN